MGGQPSKEDLKKKTDELWGDYHSIYNSNNATRKFTLGQNMFSLGSTIYQSGQNIWGYKGGERINLSGVDAQDKITTLDNYGQGATTLMRLNADQTNGESYVFLKRDAEQDSWRLQKFDTPQSYVKAVYGNPTGAINAELGQAAKNPFAKLGLSFQDHMGLFGSALARVAVENSGNAISGLLDLATDGVAGTLLSLSGGADALSDLFSNMAESDESQIMNHFSEKLNSGNFNERDLENAFWVSHGLQLGLDQDTKDLSSRSASVLENDYGLQDFRSGQSNSWLADNEIAEGRKRVMQEAASQSKDNMNPYFKLMANYNSGDAKTDLASKGLQFNQLDTELDKFAPYMDKYSRDKELQGAVTAFHSSTDLQRKTGFFKDVTRLLLQNARATSDLGRKQQLYNRADTLISGSHGENIAKGGLHKLKSEIFQNGQNEGNMVQNEAIINDFQAERAQNERRNHDLQQQFTQNEDFEPEIKAAGAD